MKIEYRHHTRTPLLARLGGEPMKQSYLTILTLGLTLGGVGCNTGSRDASPAGPQSGSAATSPNTPNLTGSTLGAFAPGPDLAGARGQHTATLLRDGRVLVTGGSDGQGVVADSELFDPLTNSWTTARSLASSPNDGMMMDPTGAFPTARQLHTAVGLHASSARAGSTCRRCSRPWRARVEARSTPTTR